MNFLLYFGLDLLINVTIGNLISLKTQKFIEYCLLDAIIVTWSQ